VSDDAGIEPWLDQEIRVDGKNSNTDADVQDLFYSSDSKAFGML
jgi:hypothetical protein